MIRPRVTTRLKRPGSALPMESNVLRPISRAPPMVTRLNQRKSSGRCQGIAPFSPMTRLRAMATMAFIVVGVREVKCVGAVAGGRC